MRSRCRCSMCPAIHISSRSWLRSSSTHEPSDPPLRVVLSLSFHRSASRGNSELALTVGRGTFPSLLPSVGCGLGFTSEGNKTHRGAAEPLFEPSRGPVWRRENTSAGPCSLPRGGTGAPAMLLKGLRVGFRKTPSAVEAFGRASPFFANSADV